MDGSAHPLPEAATGPRHEPVLHRARRFLWPALCAIAGGLLVFIAIRPDQGALPEADGRSVADEWFDSMGRLGIRALYPPTEDMHVGDLWAVVIPPPDFDGQPSPGLLGRSVRIGHLPLRRQILDAASRRPLFAEFSPDETVRRESDRLRLEISAGEPVERIALALVMFPTSQVRRTTEVAADGGSWLGAFRGTRKATLVEEISVPQALGYGIAAGEATEALLLWCNEHRLRCSQRYLENLVGYGLGANALAPAREGGAPGTVKLLMINYVFLARRIETRRVLEGAVGSGGGLGDAPEPDTPAATDTRPAGDGAAIRVTQTDHRNVSVQQTFARPVAIGYRSIAMTPFPGLGDR